MSKNIVSGAVALLMIVVPSSAFALSQPSPFTMPVIPQNPTISELLDIVSRLTEILTYLTTHPTPLPPSCPVYMPPQCAPGEHLVGGEYLDNGCQAGPRCVSDTNNPKMTVIPSYGQAPFQAAAYIYMAATSIDFGDGNIVNINPSIAALADCNDHMTPCPLYVISHPYTVPGTYAVKLRRDPESHGGNCYGADCSVIASTQVVVTGTTTNPIRVTAPNGGEQWEEGILNSVTWTPYSYNPDVNPSRDVSAYLERKCTPVDWSDIQCEKDGYHTLGKVEESGKASIHWITGELNSASQGDNLAPAGGGYYIRVVNNVTGQWDRSDAPFTLKPKSIDLKVNGSDGPITLTRGQQITLSWTSTSQGCMIVGAQRFQTGNESTIENLASNGSMLAYYTGNGGSDIVSLNCQIKANEGLWIHDNVAVNTVGLTSNIKVLTPNGGEVIPMNQSYGIRVQNAGLSTFAVALYRNDQWFAWINRYVVPSGKDVDLIMWTPSADFPIPSGDGTAYKIYVTGQRAGGSGYIDDKSDAAFSFTPTTSPSGVLTAGTDASSPALQMVSAGSTGVTLGVYKLRATGESINVKKLNVFLSTDGGGSGNPANIQQLYVYSGATLIGTAVFPGLGQNATITLSSPVNVPRDMDVRITIKADIARVGTGQPGVAGSLIKLQLASAEGTGASSGSYIGGNNNESFGKDGVGGVAGVRIQRSYPVVASVPLPSSTGLQDGKLMRFTITANSSGHINIGRLNFRLAMSGATASNVQLYGYSDSSYSLPIPGSVYGGQISNANRMSDALVSVYPFENLVIPAGVTYYFELRGTVVNSASNSAITTTLLSDGNSMGLVPFNALGDTQFAWSPNSLGTATLTNADWTNGFMVPGLPAGGISQTRTSGQLPPPPPTGSPRITYMAAANGVVSFMYSDMPSNTQLVLVNQTTGARVDYAGSTMISNGGTGSGSLPFPPNLPAGTYYLKAQNYTTQSYIAQTVSFYITASTEDWKLSCTITADKNAYVYGDLITFSWTSSNATSAFFVPDTSGKDNLQVPSGSFSPSGSQQIRATVSGNPYITMKVYGATGGEATCTKAVSVSASPSVCPVYQQPQCPTGQTLVSDPTTYEGQCAIPHWHCTTTTPTLVPFLNKGTCTYTPSASKDGDKYAPPQGSAPSTITIDGGQSACSAWCSSQAREGNVYYSCTYNGAVVSGGVDTGPVRSDVVPVSSPVPPTSPATQSCTTPTYGLTIQNGGTLRAYPYFTGRSYESAAFMTMYTTVMKCSNGTWLTCDLYGSCADKGGAVSVGSSNISNVAFEGDVSGGTVAGVSISLDQQTIGNISQLASVLAAIEGTLRTIIAEFGY